MKIGKKLKAMRTEKGMTQAALSDASGIPSTAISHFECDRRVPGLRNMARLALALRVCPAELMIHCPRKAL